jgi:hypothetical protein
MLSKNQKIGGARYIGLCLAVIACCGLFLEATTGNAMVILDPNDPNFIGYPDSGSVFNAQCSQTSDYFAVYISKSDPNPFSIPAIVCSYYPDTYHFLTWQDYYDYIYGLGSASFLLEVPSSRSCDNLSYENCLNYQPPSPTPTPSGDILTASSSISVFSTATAGDMILAIMLFALIMLTLLQIFLRKI